LNALLPIFSATEALSPIIGKSFNSSILLDFDQHKSEFKYKKHHHFSRQLLTKYFRNIDIYCYDEKN